LLLTHESLAENCRRQRERTVLIGQDWEKIGEKSEAGIESGTNPENLAY